MTNLQRLSSKYAQRSKNNAYYLQLKEIYNQLQNVISQLPTIEHQRDQLSSEKQTIEAKLVDVNKKLVTCNELLLKNIQKEESLAANHKQMNDLLKESKLQSMQFPRLLELNHTFTFKFNLTILLNHIGEIRSEPFQTSSNGYLLALGVEILKDEKTGGSSIAVNVYFLPGDFDPILLWPFPFPLTISLLQCQGKSKDIVHSIPKPMEPSVYGYSNKRNTKPCRIAPFCSLKTISQPTDGFLENESIFLRVHVDFQPAVNVVC